MCSNADCAQGRGSQSSTGNSDCMRQFAVREPRIPQLPERSAVNRMGRQPIAAVSEDDVVDVLACRAGPVVLDVILLEVFVRVAQKVEVVQLPKEVQLHAQIPELDKRGARWRRSFEDLRGADRGVGDGRILLRLGPLDSQFVQRPIDQGSRFPVIERFDGTGQFAQGGRIATWRQLVDSPHDPPRIDGPLQPSKGYDLGGGQGLGLHRLQG